MYNPIDSITIDRLHSIETERQGIQSDTQFQNWCKELKIGSRVNKVDSRAVELNSQYTRYTEWIKNESEKRSWMPEFITRIF